MTAESPDTAVDGQDRQTFSAAGQATFDIALRMGGLFLAIIGVAVLLFILKPNSFNIDVGISVLRAMSSVAIVITLTVPALAMASAKARDGRFTLITAGALWIAPSALLTTTV